MQKKSNNKKDASRKDANRKAGRRRKRILSTAAIVMLLAIGLLGALAVHYLIRDVAMQPAAEVINVNFYFRDTDYNWGYEQRQIELDEDAYIIEAVLQGLQEGPRTISFLPSIPDYVYIQGAQLWAYGILGVDFSSSFWDAAPADRVFAISSLVHTLTDLDFVNYLRFYIDGEELLNEDGFVFGLRNKENTTLEETPIMDVQTAIITLYFPDDQLMGLVAEERLININPLEAIEVSIMNAFLDGPATQGLLGLVPPGSLISVEKSLDLVIVDFNQDFYDALISGGSALEHFMVYSVVNTLTARPEATRVQIFINGLSIQPNGSDGLGLHMDLSRPFERDESLILD